MVECLKLPIRQILQHGQAVIRRHLYRFLSKLFRVTPVRYPFHFHTSVLVSHLNIGVHLFQPISISGKPFRKEGKALRKYHEIHDNIYPFRAVSYPLTLLQCGV